VPQGRGAPQRAALAAGTPHLKLSLSSYSQGLLQPYRREPE